MTLDALREREKLSVRSYNVCYYNSLTSLDDIIAFYLKWSTFQKLRNCGDKSNLELIAIAKKYIAEPSLIENRTTVEDTIIDENLHLLENFISLNRLQRRILQNQLQ